jgi:hypothetical protein
VLFTFNRSAGLLPLGLLPVFGCPLAANTSGHRIGGADEMQGLTVMVLPDAPGPTSLRAEASLDSSIGYENDRVRFPASSKLHHQLSMSMQNLAARLAT